jgi:cephalosporin hydroxylase
MQHYGRIDDFRVISIDIDTSVAAEQLAAADPQYEESISLITSDIRAPGLPDVVAGLLPPEARCLVVEDSAHIYETTMAALEGFARFVPLDGFFVVEDGWVDVPAMRTTPDVPRGVLPAVRDWLDTPAGRCFRVERDLELYGVTSHPSGYLRRIRDDEQE